MDIHALIAKYDAPVPRYTSYPTAPHFSPDVGAATLRALAARAAGRAAFALPARAVLRPAVLVLRLPHHRRAQPGRRWTPMPDLLLAEIDLVAETIGRPLPVAHVHWGGGTPTALPPARLVEIMQRLRSSFAFDRERRSRSRSTRAPPAQAALDALAAMGCTRASLGVQDFDERVQDAVNRHQSFEMTRACAEALRRPRHRSINLDLMYGLPVPDRGLGGRHRGAGARARAGSHRRVRLRARALDEEAPDAAAGGALPGALERWRQFFAAERGHHAGAAGGRSGSTITRCRTMSLRSRPSTATMRRNFQGYTTDDRAGAARPRRLLHRVAAAGLCAERGGGARLPRPRPRRRTGDRARHRAHRRRPAAPRGDRAADVPGPRSIWVPSPRDHGADPAPLRAAGGRRWRRWRRTG